MVENAVEQVREGDVVFYGEESFKVLKTLKKTKVHAVAVYSDQYHPSTMDLRDFRKRCVPLSVAPGEQFHFNDYGPARYAFHGVITIAERDVRTVPVGYSGGKLNVRDHGHRTLRCLVEGDPKLWALIQEDYAVDVGNAAVVHAELELTASADVRGFFKADLIAYVIAVNAPVGRDTIMEKVAQLEGKPWVPTSNSDYFRKVRSGGIVGKYLEPTAVMTVAGKGAHGRILYGLAAEGERRAAKVRSRLGDEPGRV